MATLTTIDGKKITFTQPNHKLNRRVHVVSCYPGLTHSFVHEFTKRTKGFAKCIVYIDDYTIIVNANIPFTTRYDEYGVQTKHYYATSYHYDATVTLIQSYIRAGIVTSFAENVYLNQLPFIQNIELFDEAMYRMVRSRWARYIMWPDVPNGETVIRLQIGEHPFLYFGSITEQMSTELNISEPVYMETLYNRIQYLFGEFVVTPKAIEQLHEQITFHDGNYGCARCNYCQCMVSTVEARRECILFELTHRFKISSISATYLTDHQHLVDQIPPDQLIDYKKLVGELDSLEHRMNYIDTADGNRQYFNRCKCTCKVWIDRHTTTFEYVGYTGVMISVAPIANKISQQALRERCMWVNPTNRDFLDYDEILTIPETERYNYTLVSHLLKREVVYKDPLNGATCRYCGGKILTVSEKAKMSFVDTDGEISCTEDSVKCHSDVSDLVSYTDFPFTSTDPNCRSVDYIRADPKARETCTYMNATISDIEYKRELNDFMYGIDECVMPDLSYCACSESITVSTIHWDELAWGVSIHRARLFQYLMSARTLISCHLQYIQSAEWYVNVYNVIQAAGNLVRLCTETNWKTSTFVQTLVSKHKCMDTAHIRYAIMEGTFPVLLHTVNFPMDMIAYDTESGGVYVRKTAPYPFALMEIHNQVDTFNQLSIFSSLIAGLVNSCIEYIFHSVCFYAKKEYFNDPDYVKPGVKMHGKFSSFVLRIDVNPLSKLYTDRDVYRLPQCTLLYMYRGHISFKSDHAITIRSELTDHSDSDYHHYEVVDVIHKTVALAFSTLGRVPDFIEFDYKQIINDVNEYIRDITHGLQNESDDYTKDVYNVLEIVSIYSERSIQDLGNAMRLHSYASTKEYDIVRSTIDAIFNQSSDLYALMAIQRSTMILYQYESLPQRYNERNHPPWAHEARAIPVVESDGSILVDDPKLPINHKIVDFTTIPVCDQRELLYTLGVRVDEYELHSTIDRTAYLERLHFAGREQFNLPHERQRTYTSAIASQYDQQPVALPCQGIYERERSSKRTAPIRVSLMTAVTPKPMSQGQRKKDRKLQKKQGTQN